MSYNLKMPLKIYDKERIVGSKITLYSEQDLIESVKQYAKKHNTSVSRIVTDFFKTLTENEEKVSSGKKCKNTHKLYGILKDAKIEENEYKKYLQKKYL